MNTPMENLRDMIQRMTENGGDYDLFCVLGLIDDRFLKDESHKLEVQYQKGFDNGFKEGKYSSDPDNTLFI